MGLKRRMRREPVSRQVIDRHNQHKPLTYPEWKAKQKPEWEPPIPHPSVYTR